MSDSEKGIWNGGNTFTKLIRESEDYYDTIDSELEDREEFLVIWTTTPWTLPANTFVAVNEEFTYQKVMAVKGGVEEKLWIEK